MPTRPANPADASAIAHIHVASWRATYPGIVPQGYLNALDEADFTAKWTEWLALPGILISVAEDQDGAPVGFASAGPIRKPTAGCDAELYAIYLLPEAQGRGIGRQLVAHLETKLIAQGKQKILAWVLRDNPATAFYGRLGGKLVAEETIEIASVTLPELAYAWPLTTTSVPGGRQ